VAAGDDHACAVTSDGGLVCWGKNDAGQLGPNAAGLLRSVRPVAVFASGVTSVVAGGGRHTCAVQGGTVQCWGANDAGQLGDGTAAVRLGVVSTGLTGATALALGESHSCAIVGGAIWCWGANGSGQLGTGDLVSRPSPVASLATTGVTSLSAAGDDTCAVAAGGARCWGLDLDGQTGSGDTSNPRPPKSTPVAVPLSGSALQVAVGRQHACATSNGGGGTPLFCWGSGGEGEMGNGSTTTPVLVPVQASRIDNNRLASVFVAGEAFTCSSKPGDVTMKCAGRNDQAQCGGPPSAPAELEVAFGGSAVAASAGRAFTCVLADVGGARVVKCWGSNTDGQLGRTTPTTAPSQTPDPSPTPDLVGS
jgi:alpha-tubulin suppressor-like RCC1 family protein